MVLSGKPLEVNAAGRKGKYSLEVRPLSISAGSFLPDTKPQNALHIRTHAAVDALEQNRPL